MISVTLYSLLVVPDPVSETLYVEALHAIFVVLLAVVLLVHLHLLLLGLHQCSLVVVHLIVHVVVVARALDRVLLVEFIQQLHEHLVVVVEPLRFNLLSPVFVVHLHVVKNRIHQHADVRVLVREQFKNDRHDLSLVKHNFTGGPEEQELKERVQNLLNHFVVLLLGTKHILQKFDEVAIGNNIGSSFIAAHSSAEHDTFEDDIVFCIPGHELTLQEVNNALLLHDSFPRV